MTIGISCVACFAAGAVGVNKVTMTSTLRRTSSAASSGSRSICPSADRNSNRMFIDRVRRFKPAPQVYHMVAAELGVPPAAICMVAAHVWDTIGAQSIGCSGALVARPGNAPLPVRGLPQPQAVAPDLPALATQLIKLWR